MLRIYTPPYTLALFLGFSLMCSSSSSYAQSRGGGRAGGAHVGGGGFHAGGVGGGASHAGGFGPGGYHASAGSMYGGMHGISTPHVPAMHPMPHGRIDSGGGIGPMPQIPHNIRPNVHVPLQQVYGQKQAVGIAGRPGIGIGHEAHETPGQEAREHGGVGGYRGNGYPYAVGNGYYYHPTFGYGIPYGGYWHSPRTYYYGYTFGLPYVTAYNYTPSYYAYNYSTNYANAAGVPLVATQDSLTTNDQEASTMTGGEYLAAAQTALKEADFPKAIKMAGHAAIEMNENAQVHEVLWLAMFLEGDFQGAAIEAHAVESMGARPAWGQVANQLSNPDAFSKSLRSLEEFVGRNQDSSFGTFLLGYQYLVLQHNDAAAPLIQRASELAPKDQVASSLLTSFNPVSTDIPRPEPELPSPVKTLVAPDSAR